MTTIVCHYDGYEYKMTSIKPNTSSRDVVKWFLHSIIHIIHL